MINNYKLLYLYKKCINQYTISYIFSDGNNDTNYYLDLCLKFNVDNPITIFLKTFC